MAKKIKLTGEDFLQEQCCLILDLTKLVYYSVPNGANKTQMQAQLFKQTGLKKGVPDLCIVDSTFTDFKGLYVELKFGKSTTSPEQKEWLNKLVTRGYAIAVVRTTNEFIELLKMHYAPFLKHIKF